MCEIKFSNLRSFPKARSGNIAIIMAFVLLPLIVLAGGTVDLIRISNASLQLNRAVESAALAAASLSNNGDLNSTLNDYILKNVPEGSDWSSLNIEPNVIENTDTSRVIEVTASVTIKTPFLTLIGQQYSNIQAFAAAAQEAKFTEVSLVIDISSSMRGNRLVQLREASHDFLDLMLEDNLSETTAINFIPFGGTVNIGPNLITRYFPLSGYMDGQPASEYGDGKEITQKLYRFLGARNCIEYRAEDFDLDDIELNSRAQVPHFYYWNQNNPWCPENGTSQMYLNRNDLAELKNAVDDLELSDGTGMDIGLLWGAKALSPELKTAAALDGGSFSDRPADWDDKQTQKVIVLMTDGGITRQFRPKNPWKNLTPKDYGTGIVNARNNKQNATDKGNINSASSTPDNSVAYMKTMCDQAKAKGIIIYTVGFKIQKNTLPDQSLSYCATSPSHYYFVETSDLSEAFKAIASSIKSLRIVG